MEGSGEVAAAMRACGHCGSAVPADVRVCQKCGVEFTATPADALSAADDGGAASPDQSQSPHSGPVTFAALNTLTDTSSVAPTPVTPRPAFTPRTPVLGIEVQPEVMGGKYCVQCGVEYDGSVRFCPSDGTTLRARDSRESLVGQVIADRYHVLKFLGEGGMGRVYLAQHVKMNRQCAIKVLGAAHAQDADAAQRFTHEASFAAQITHPNVAAIYDFGESADLVYIAMEFVDGSSLTSIIAEGGLETRRAVEIARSVADGLAAAHALGIVHRDLKPDNIMVTTTHDGQELVKVVDFGIAKALGMTGRNITHTGVVIGTPEYMSPEQIFGEAVDGRSDIFSLGCILYQMLTGVHAFEAPSREAMVNRRLIEAAPGPKARRPEIPRALDDLVRHALERSPTQRFQTAAEMRDELSVVMDELKKRETPRWFERVISGAGPTKSRPAMTPGRDASLAAARPAMTGWSSKRRARSRATRVVIGVGGVIVLGVAAMKIFRKADNTNVPAPPGVASQSAPPSAGGARSDSQGAGPGKPVGGINSPSAPAAGTAGSATSSAGGGGAGQQTASSAGAASAGGASVGGASGANASARRATTSQPDAKPAGAGGAARGAPDSPDVVGIKAALARYEAAIESRDGATLRRAYPGISADELDKFQKRFFASAKSIQVKRHTYGPVHVDGLTATVDLDLDLNFAYSDGQTSELPLRYVVSLGKEAVGWVIERIAPR